MPYYRGSKTDYLLWLADKLFNWKEKKLYKTIKQRLSADDFDIIFCSSFNLFPLLTAKRLCEEWNKPMVVDLRDIAEQWGKNNYTYIKRGLKTGNTWFNGIIANLYIQHSVAKRNNVLKQASAVTTISPWHKQLLGQINPNTHLIYNGYDEQTFTAQNKVNNKFIITYTGKIYNFNFHDPQLLFSALALIQEKYHLPDIELHFYCEDEIHGQLIKLAHESGIEKITHIHSYVSSSQILEIIHNSSICLILTCKSTEDGSHGIMTTKFFEALGVEKPVLCVPSDEECLAQVIEETNAGVAAKTIEEVESFILDKYHEWQQNGFTRQKVNQSQKALFSRQRQAEQFMNIFNNLIKQ